MFARGQYHSGKRNHPFLLDRLSDHRVCLSTDLSIRDDVVGPIQIDVIDFDSRYESVNVDRVSSFDRNSLELILGYFNVAAFAQLIAHHDVFGVDLTAGLGIELAIFDPIAGSSVDLMESEFLSLRDRREELDRARNKRQP